MCEQGRILFGRFQPLESRLQFLISSPEFSLETFRALLKNGGGLRGILSLPDQLCKLSFQGLSLCLEFHDCLAAGSSLLKKSLLLTLSLLMGCIEGLVVRAGLSLFCLGSDESISPRIRFRRQSRYLTLQFPIRVFRLK